MVAVGLKKVLCCECEGYGPQDVPPDTWGPRGSPLVSRGLSPLTCKMVMLWTPLRRASRI